MSEPTQVIEDCSPLLVATSPRSDLSKIDPVLKAMLKTVCETIGWEYGEAWVAIADKMLHISSIWQTQTRLSRDRQLDWEHFHACSQEFVLQAGEGLPGRVWATQAPEWMVDVSAESESYFLRHQIARAFGVKAGLGVPVTMQQLQVVLVFFQSEARDVDPQGIELTEATIAKLQFLN
ncbi:MAG: GAF domain-containing protein [Trichocoleus desertorum ATA4-8-CV12]|jgi:hypothetical protein|nr:GAF domain-containing protein [Trichocoleus desertorum ATA4-8-CV12]